MNAGVFCQVSVRVTAVLIAARVASAGEPWRVVEQPGLEQALERAPVLQTESLGEPALCVAGDLQAGDGSAPRPAGQPVSGPSEVRGVVLGIDGTAFTINGKKTFLLGASYYGALGAPDDFIARDLDELKTLGFNWIPVFGVWDAFDNNVSAADPDRRVTAAGDPTNRADLSRYLVEAGLDFISPHLARDAGTEERTADVTRRYLGWMNALGRSAPIHYQDPFRRDYVDYRGFWQPEVATFCTDLRDAQLGEVERQFLKRAASCVQ